MYKILVVKKSIYLLYTFCDVDSFSDKKESHNFDYHNFSDVKYLYFLCLEIDSFWVHLGPVLGLEPIEQTLAHVM